MEFVSIGPYCSCVDIIKTAELRKSAYPFDSIFSSLDMVKHCINDRFKIFLDQRFYQYCSESSTQHIFYSNFINSEILRRHHIAHNLPKIAYNLTNREIFVHHNLSNIDTYSSFVRRCNRLLDLIDNNNKIVFIYYNRYTRYFNDLLDFYNTFSSNKNICVVGIFENRGVKRMLYKSSNCKIYQNYDRSLIFDEIKSSF